VINALGEISVPETLITTASHLHRGDDAFAFNGRAAWMTGNAQEKSLHLHLVDTALSYEEVIID
jgi:hypothetical protein